MSGLTVELLSNSPQSRRPSRWRSRFGEIAGRLKRAYGTPRLGNVDDPVGEIFYILLSAKTADRQYRRTHAALNCRFPTLGDIARAPLKQIFRCILSGGMANVKAARMKRIAKILAELGDDPAGRLREMTAAEVYAFLTALPGVGPKSALCVMMWSLNFDVFPVDVNVSRIAIRLGALRPGLKHYHYQQLLPPLIPDGRCKELHVGLVVHGRSVCLPRNPRCESCSLRDLCEYGKRFGKQRARLTRKRVEAARSGQRRLGMTRQETQT